MSFSRKKNSLKLLIISDSHSNIANLKHVLGFGKKIGVGAVIHCGDWNNFDSIETVLSYDIPLYSVLGNADIDPVIGKRLMLKSKGFDRVYLGLKLDSKNIGVIHKLSDLVPSRLLPSILFYGDTHKQMVKMVGMVKMVNPGALEHDINFAVYDTVTDEVEFMNTNG